METDLLRDRNAQALMSALRNHIPALEDPTVTDVFANDDGRLWTKRWGAPAEVQESEFPASVAEAVLRMAAGATDTEINRHSPRLSAELPNGTRLQGFIPPVTTRPVLILRLHREVVIPLCDYVSSGFMTASAAGAIRQALRERRNIVVAGPTGSGKTTLANAMLMELASSTDRIAILEDTRELRCDAPNTIRLRSSRVVSLRDLVQDSLRIKPDRIVIGEIRSGAVARETLNAWNTGHPGGIATIHADSALDTLHRLEHLLSEEFAAPPRHLIGRSIDDIIFIGVSGGSASLKDHLRVRWSESRSDYDVMPALGTAADS